MKNIKSFCLTVSLLIGALAASAQHVSPVDFMRMNPYQMKSNPAADLPYQSVMSLVIGNLDLTLNTTTLRYDNLFDFDAQGRPVAVNLKKFADGIPNKNHVGLEASESLFTLYRRIDAGMLTFDYNIRAQADLKFNDGLFKLAAYGNAAFLGEYHPAEIRIDLNAQAFQELSVGYQRNINERLSVGGRAKLLFGLANVTTDAFEARLFTDPESYALRAQENIAVRASMLSAVTLKDGDLATNGGFSMGDLFHNPGLAIDLGAEYRFNRQFSGMAAVRDLGFISWGGNNMQMRGQISDMGQYYDQGDFIFNGLSAEQIERIGSDTSYRRLFLDTLRQYFNIDFLPAARYARMLNANVLLRGSYDIDGHNRISMQLQGVFLGSGFRPAVTWAYSGSFYKMLDVCATYTVMPGSYDNIGIGVAGNFNTFHIYLTTNNFIGLFKPLNTSALNAQLGIVFNLRMPDNTAVD